MLFLQPTETEKLTFANMAYDSKTSVWCPHKTEAFVRATVESYKTEKKGKEMVERAICITDKGDVRRTFTIIHLRLFILNVEKLLLRQLLSHCFNKEFTLFSSNLEL